MIHDPAVPTSHPGYALSTQQASTAPPQRLVEVNVTDPIELQLWALHFDATTGHLRRGVAAVGTAVAAVAAWIDRNRANDAELIAIRG